MSTAPRTVRSIILDQHQDTGIYGARGWLPGLLAKDLLTRLDVLEGKSNTLLFVDGDKAQPGLYSSLLDAILYAMAAKHWGAVDRLLLVLQWLKA